jgi:hypothetical protein
LNQLERLWAQGCPQFTNAELAEKARELLAYSGTDSEVLSRQEQLAEILRNGQARKALLVHWGAQRGRPVELWEPMARRLFSLPDDALRAECRRTLGKLPWEEP